MLAALKQVLRQGFADYLAPLALLCVMLLAGCSMLRGAERSAAEPEPIIITSLAKVGQLGASPTDAAHDASSSQLDAPDSAGRESPLVPLTSTPLSTLPPQIATQMAEGAARSNVLLLSAQATALPITSHTVAAGDTLTRIAERFGVSIASLLAANNLANPDYLEVGQVIQLPQPPVDYTSAFRILPDSRLVRSIGASSFDSARFIESQRGVLPRMTVAVQKRGSDGADQSHDYPASQIIERVSLEYSLDTRILLAFLEYSARLLSDRSVDRERQLYPLLEKAEPPGLDRAGLYKQLSWLADTLNRGFYDWKYRGVGILEFPDGSRLYYEPALNAASIAIQYALANMRSVADWKRDIEEAGLYRTYRDLFGDPFTGAQPTVPTHLRQPDLTLPFPKGDVWRFTGGFHGGWGNGSAWAAVDFSPPDEEGQGAYCYVSSFPITAVARGTIARLDEGLVVQDLDQDGDEGSGWTILYLHLDRHDSLQEGQTVEAGNILGYASCSGGFSTATHLHIARRYNGEWIPADCIRCPPAMTIPPFVMSGWKVVGLGSQLYQGFMVNLQDNRSAVAEQGRFTDINEISW